MTKSLKTALSAAAALLVATAMPSFAQDAGAGVDVDAGVTVEAPAMDAEVGAGADAGAKAMADNTYGSVISSVATSATVDLSGVVDETDVTIVLLSSLQGNAETEAAALDQAIGADAELMATLHSNVEANATIKAKLEAEGYLSTDVVAIKGNEDGSVVVYVDDRAA